MFTFDLHWQFQHLLNPYLLPINLGLVILALVLAWLGYTKPKRALGWIAALLPTYLLRTSLAGLPLTYLEVAIVIIFFSWLTRALIRREPINLFRHPFRWPVGLFFVAAALSVFVAPDLRAAAGLWKAYVLEPLLVWVMISSLSDQAAVRRSIICGLSLGGLMISLIAIIQWSTGFGIAEPTWLLPNQRRVTSIFTSPNAVGLFLGPIIIVSVGWLLQQRKHKAEKPSALVWVAISGIVTALVAIGFTKSDGTALGLAAAAAWLLYFGWSKRWTLALVAIGVVAAAVIMPMQQRLIQEITFSSPAGQNRLALWGGAWSYLTESPTQFILGAGIHGFPAIQDAFRDPLKLEPLLYPHNIALNFWIEYGLLGFIAVIWLLAECFAATSHHTGQDRWWRLGLQATFIAIICHGLVDVPYFKNDLATLMWMLIALATANMAVSSAERPADA